MGKILAFCIGALLVCLNAAANTFGNDRSEGWWDPNESGWGAMMSHQQTTIFMAMFLYGADRNPTWYSATLKCATPCETYSGELISTTGPAHTGPFDPQTVTRTVVGTATLVTQGWDHATLTYTVGGQVVTKSIQRMTWASNQLSGIYYGGLVGNTSNCSLAADNGFLSLIANMTISHNGSQLAIAGNFQNNRGGSSSCAFTSTYSQSGRMGDAQGNYTCNTGEFGTFTLTRLEATFNGILASATAQSNLCRYVGRFGAIKID